MADFILEPGETKIDTWTVIYQSPNGGKFNGKLLITDKKLYYDARFDVSTVGLLGEALFVKSGSEDYLAIPKTRIANIETKKSFLKKRVILTLDNGQIHIFDYGMLNIDKIVDAIKK